MSDQRIVRCAFCGRRFWTTQMEELPIGSEWICDECEKLEHFDRNLLQALNRIADELFALVEKAEGKKEK